MDAAALCTVEAIYNGRYIDETSSCIRASYKELSVFPLHTYIGGFHLHLFEFPFMF